MPILDKYKIKRSTEEDIMPEETFVDSVSGHTVMEVPIGHGAFRLFYLIAGVVFAVFIARSFQMQIIQGEQFAELANRNTTYDYPVSISRGIIYDAQSRSLVENSPVYDLVAIQALLSDGEALDQDIAALAPVVDYGTAELAKLFSDNSGKANFVIRRDMSEEAAKRAEELSVPGIFVIKNLKRYYPSGPAAAHVLGYTANVSSADMENDKYYALTDRIGRLGIEAQYEADLRGSRHRKVNFKTGEAVMVNENARGNDVYLTINKDIQERLYKSLTDVFASSGVKRGAAVVQNPKTGAVLGLVSMPSFDSNVFENPSDPSSSTKVSQLLNNPNKPILNRAIAGRYSPGSTIKPLLALAGLKEAVVTPRTTVYANGSISIKSEVDPNVYYTFRDWKVHGLTDIKKAIADSVDIYFYILGGGYGGSLGLGIDRIAAYLKAFGADILTGIDLPGETVGLVPTKDWKKQTKGESWFVGDTYNISIGQGDLHVTPIWINSYINSIANGGKIMKPYLAREVRDPAGSIVSSFGPQAVGEIPFDHVTLDIVKQGMKQTVESGTATLLQGVPVTLAAKTGTAQVTGRGLNSLFTVFGPYEDPEISMTVLVENINQSQGLAVRVANDFLLWYFGQFKEGESF